MANKVFVSYKHGDSDVYSLPSAGLLTPTTGRHYVNLLENILVNQHDYIYKGENDNESLQGFKDETIESKLRKKIFDSTVTIVLISKNMRNPSLLENDQWIPWEISYSLREKTREGRSSSANAILAVVLPDKNNSYEYFIKQTGCSHCGSINWNTSSLFSILGRNMFNRKQSNTIQCRSGICGPLVHTGEDHSYIYPVRWDKFIGYVNHYIDHVIKINESIDDYELTRLILAL